jgi:hypothetical protein
VHLVTRDGSSACELGHRIAFSLELPLIPHSSTHATNRCNFRLRHLHHYRNPEHEAGRFLRYDSLSSMHCMQPSYQRSARGARGRDLCRIVPFTFNNIQRGHKRCFADSTCSCSCCLSDSTCGGVGTRTVTGIRTVTSLHDCLEKSCLDTLMPPFNLCYVTRIIELHGSCILHFYLDFAPMFELFILLATGFTCGCAGSSMSPFIAMERNASGLLASSTTSDLIKIEMRRADSALLFAQFLSPGKQ